MRLFLILFLLTIPVVSASTVYVLELENLDNSIVFSSVKVIAATTPQKAQNKAFSAEVMDFTEKVVYKTTFEPSQYGPFTLVIPYHKEGKEIQLHYNDKTLKIPVAHFADTCGNDVCEPHELGGLCQKDCQEQETEPKVEEPEEIEEESKGIIDEILEETEEPGAVIEKSASAIIKKPKKGINSLGMAILIVLGLIITVICGLCLLFLMMKRAKAIQEYANQWAQKGYPMGQIKKGLEGKYMKWEINRALKK